MRGSESKLLDALWAVQQREGLTDAALALRLGVTGATISRYRSGERYPSGATFEAIVRAFPHLIGYILETADRK